MTFKINKPTDLRGLIKRAEMLAQKYGIRCDLGENRGSGSWFAIKGRYEVVGDGILFTLNKKPFGMSRDYVIDTVTNFIHY